MAKDIGSIIRTLRKTAGMSQSRLADKIGVSYQQVQKYEKGLSKLSINRLQLIAEAFNVPVLTFLEGDVASSAQAATSDIKEDEAQVVMLYRRIKEKRLRKSVVNMIENILSAVEGRE